MTKNIPGSRKHRRSKLLRDMNGQDITLKMGRYVEGQFKETENIEGRLEYTPKIEGGNMGYVLVPSTPKGIVFSHDYEYDQDYESAPNEPPSIRLYIREVDKINPKNKLIKYVVGKR